MSIVIVGGIVVLVALMWVFIMLYENIQVKKLSKQIKEIYEGLETIIDGMEERAIEYENFTKRLIEEQEERNEKDFI